MGGFSWSALWKLVLSIVMPTLGDVLRKIALYLWDIVEEWAKGQLAKTGAKVASTEKAAMFGTLLAHLEPDLTDEQVTLVRETAHSQKTRRDFAGGRKPVA